MTEAISVLEEQSLKRPTIPTQVIGSLPRPAVVRELFQRRQELTVDRFSKTLDEMVVFAIRLQEHAGIDVVRDGAWRRVQYIREFLNPVGGFERCRKSEHQGEVKLTEVVLRRTSANA